MVASVGLGLHISSLKKELKGLESRMDGKLVTLRDEMLDAISEREVETGFFLFDGALLP